MECLDDSELHGLAEEVLQAACDRDGYVVTAESCTGGYMASALTGIEGLAHGFDRGFIAYSDAAKAEILDIAPEAIERAGAVSEEIGRLMAQRALEKSDALAAVGVTGFTGCTPSGQENGLVHIVAISRAGKILHRECHLGDVSRDEGRRQACAAGFELLRDVIVEQD